MDVRNSARYWEGQGACILVLEFEEFMVDLGQAERRIKANSGVLS